MVCPKGVFETFRFSLLEQLATFKTFLIFCDDDQFVCNIFTCCYATVHAHQSEKTETIPRRHSHLASRRGRAFEEGGAGCHVSTARVSAAVFLDVIDSYPSLFAEFLNRQRDVNAEIRAEMAVALGPLLAAHPKHAERFDSMLKDREIDKDDLVRCIAVESIGKCIRHASESLLQLLALRLCDRKPHVRKVTLSQVYELFTNATPSYSGPSPTFEPNEERNDLMDWGGNKYSSGEALGRRIPRSSIEPVTMKDVLETRMLKHSWLPDAILRSNMSLNDAGDQKRAREIERLILERIPATSKHDGVSIRAGLRRLAIFISQLSETSCENLMAIVRSRWNTRAALVSIAQFRLNSRKAGGPLSHVERQTAPVHPTFSRKSHGKGQDKNISTATPTIGLRNHAFELASVLAAQIAALITLEHCQKYCMFFSTAVDLKVFEKVFKALHPL
ncbi:unnamed protein product [Agarophyton chilense]